MNRSKDKGTAWESMLVRWLRQRLADDRIERRALHGSKDLGDIYGLCAHGTRGIIEAKNYRQWGPHDLEEWERQTLDERDNADADWAILVPKRYGVGEKSLGRTPVWVTYSDLLRLANVSYVRNVFSDQLEGSWHVTDLETVCSLMEVADGAL